MKTLSLALLAMLLSCGCDPPKHVPAPDVGPSATHGAATVREAAATQKKKVAAAIDAGRRETARRLVDAGGG